jgi:hypothetical protein
MTESWHREDDRCKRCGLHGNHQTCEQWWHLSGQYSATWRGSFELRGGVLQPLAVDGAAAGRTLAGMGFGGSDSRHETDPFRRLEFARRQTEDEPVPAESWAARAAAAAALGATTIPTPADLEARKSALASLNVDEQVRAIVAAMNRGEGACPRLPDLTNEAARLVRERMRKQGWDCNLDATRVWWRPA